MIQIEWPDYVIRASCMRPMNKCRRYRRTRRQWHCQNEEEEEEYAAEEQTKHNAYLAFNYTR